MSKLYGFFSGNLYKMGVKTATKPVLVDPFTSSTFVTEDRGCKRFTEMIQINTMDFFAEESNEYLHDMILSFARLGKLTSISTLFYGIKISLDYSILAENGTLLEGGIRYIQADMDDVLIPMPLTEDNHMNYRHGKRVVKGITFDRLLGSNYGIMQEAPSKVIFQINNVKVLGNCTDSGSSQYIINLGKSAQCQTFPYYSKTVSSMEQGSVVLLDSEKIGITFQPMYLNYIPQAITVQFEILLNLCCELYDDTDLWKIIAENGGSGTTTAPSDFDVPNMSFNSPFDPVVNRPRHPGNHPMPMPPFIPDKKPLGNCGCNKKPPLIPGMPGHCPGGAPITPPNPITPNPDWNPDGTVVPPAPTHQNPHDFNEKEWCMSDPYDDPSILFTVVSDDIANKDYDATCMVKYSEVCPYVSDTKIGDKVKKCDVCYY